MYGCHLCDAKIQPSILCSVALYFSSISFKHFEKYSTGNQIPSWYYLRTTPTAIAEASDSNMIGSQGSKTFIIEAKVSMVFNLPKAYALWHQTQYHAFYTTSLSMEQQSWKT